MKEQLSIFNFSLKKVLDLEPDSFKKARYQIVFTILTFSLLKAFIVLPYVIKYEQHLQLARLIFIIVSLLVLTKIILYKPASLLAISHIMLVMSLATIWSNLFAYVQAINIFTIQLIFLTTLVSYYLIGGVQAACYSAMAILPAVYYLIARHAGFVHINMPSEEVDSEVSDAVVILNFASFLLIHYLYYRAFRKNLMEKEALNLQLQNNVVELNALAESRSLFLSTMSHELRTPLNGVIGMAYLLKDSALEEQKDKLNILEFSANNLLSVINDVLDYNKSELGKIELEAVPVSLPELLKKIHSGLELKASEKHLDLVLETDESLENIWVITDPTRLTQIIYNLAGNAIKFTDEGMVKIKVTLRELLGDRATFHFCISDTGIGIAEERQQAIFDPFTQASSDTTRKYGGTGLGLAIVKRLLSLFDSAIELESHSGKGSVFKFHLTLPLCQTQMKAVAEQKADTTYLKGLKLLIVEDNRINVLLLQKLLSKWEVETVIAWNGQEAIDQLQLQYFDCILMDIHMPVMDGYTATSSIRNLADQMKANVPIIAITASVSDQLYAKIKMVGMQDYVHKPFQPKQLFDKLKLIHEVM
ncbi:ATP-binding protein [Mucilaginibacter jinjuensis]|uniref:histidine kinase n=1 Tax=Mucilaginibacter jinjuensis TaxID=1176721 RepID=A0ABY7TBA0_9SPHI|nr:ATP-binding protein [Mucilaginibacter jinjuensis]WCT13622.1 ATP-binding protein [Mucilaginibacter jinjuensis]